MKTFRKEIDKIAINKIAHLNWMVSGIVKFWSSKFEAQTDLKILAKIQTLKLKVWKVLSQNFKSHSRDDLKANFGWIRFGCGSEQSWLSFERKREPENN